MTVQEATYRPEAGTFYGDNYAHLADELRKLDILIRLRVTALRQQMQARAAAASSNMYVSHEEVDRLLDEEYRPTSVDQVEIRQALDHLQNEIQAGVMEGLNRGVFLGLPQLTHRFGLSSFEVHAVLICLAPELRRKYDTLYAYLQDDIIRKRPSIDLVLDLLCETEADRWDARAMLSRQAPLLRTGILQPVDDMHSPSGSSGLAQFLQLDARILHFILGHQAIDARLVGLTQVRRATVPPEDLPVASSVKEGLLTFVPRHFSEPSGPKLALHLYGPYGAGKRDLSLALCDTLGCTMLCLDAERLPEQEAEFLLRLAFRESLLLQAPLYIEQADVFLRDDDKARALRKLLAQAVEAYGWFTLLAGEAPWGRKAVFERVLFHSIALPMPDVSLQESAWQQALAPLMPDAEPMPLAGALAQRFRLTPGQIRDAVASLASRRTVEDDRQTVTFEGLAAACRAQSNRKLGELATKVAPGYAWIDLVLPNDKQVQLQEICAQVRHQYRVFSQWGFGRKLSRGKGLSTLFSGPPGTGKTMAAEVIARDLQLDLYKIDLSRVVSKYIGETEKNLSRIFAEAENSNAILFFDEADALFGKRTEISDAHDRYANIETSFLLQQMEEYDGVVILASNLRENMDNAFLRRIRFIVKFPFPDAASRLRIWRGHFPQEAPVSEEVDYELLAERVQVAGGNIKNIALNAAFFAAENGGVIGMEHILWGTRREFEKIGKLWDEQCFIRTRP